MIFWLHEYIYEFMESSGVFDLLQNGKTEEDDRIWETKQFLDSMGLRHISEKASFVGLIKSFF